MSIKNMQSAKLKHLAIPLFMMFLLSACGGSGGGGGNTAPSADAGTATDISKTFTVNLDGSASSDADGDTLTYRWTQTKGPDVTGGTANSAADTVVVNVFEDLKATYFVDGDNGDDTNGTGSRNNPFASLTGAVSALTTSQEDIYVKTRATAAVYDETASVLIIPVGTSLYGGYDANWNRNTGSNKTIINTDHLGVQFNNVTQDAWFSGFVLSTSDSPSATYDVFGVYGFGDGSASMYVQYNLITTGNVQAGTDSSPGTNYGVALRSLALADVSNNTIMTGTGGNGIEGAIGTIGPVGGDGSNGNQTGGRKAPGGSGIPGGNGGSGGTRGAIVNGNGGNGSTGNAVPAPLGGTIAGGNGGAGGSGNTAADGSGASSGNVGGNGVPGNSGNGVGSLTGFLFTISSGAAGSRGGYGSGGGGGGGGEASSINVGGGGTGASGGVGNIGNQGGYGGGGASGADDFAGLGIGGWGSGGGNGGPGGPGGWGGAGGGGPSYGVIFAAGMEPVLTGNTITSGNGGLGGKGGLRGNGGEGGTSGGQDTATAGSDGLSGDRNWP